MKKKYTLTVANSQLDIITEEDNETIDTVVGIVDRKIREVYLHSKGDCSRTNAAILVCLDYCAEKLELQKTVKSLNSEIERLTSVNEEAQKEKAALEAELEALRQSISTSAPSHKSAAKNVLENQIAFDDIKIEEVPTDDVKEEIAVESLAPQTDSDSDLPRVKLKKKKVRAMFDNISFDDI